MAENGNEDESKDLFDTTLDLGPNLAASRETISEPEGIRFLPEEDDASNNKDTQPAPIGFIQEEENKASTGNRNNAQATKRRALKDPEPEDRVKQMSLKVDMSSLNSPRGTAKESISKMKMEYEDLKRFLYDGEEVVFAGLIIKRSFSGVGIIPRKRQLILTKMTNSLLWLKWYEQVNYFLF